MGSKSNFSFKSLNPQGFSLVVINQLVVVENEKSSND